MQGVQQHPRPHHGEFELGSLYRRHWVVDRCGIPFLARSLPMRTRRFYAGLGGIVLWATSRFELLISHTVVY